MKEIKAIIQPFMMEPVLRALSEIPALPGITVSQVMGWGKTRGAGAKEPVTEAGHRFARKLKLEIVVPDEMGALLIDTIASAAQTGRPGDGKLFVYDVFEVVKIRTGERGEPAL